MKRYQDAGAEFIESARSRAEEFLRDLGAIGESTGRQAGSTFEDVLGGGRRSTDQFLDLIRREVASQLSNLGLATKGDLEALERRLSGSRTGRSGGADTGATTRSTAAKKAPARKATAQRATARKSTGRKATATGAAGTRSAATAKRSTTTGRATSGTKKAPATRTAASTRAAPSKRAGRSGTA